MSTSIFRVRFIEWQAFGKDVSAASATEAIQLARAIRDSRGTIDFDEIDGGTDSWEAEAIPLTPEQEIAALRAASRLALRALRKTKKFRVGKSNSSAIASALAQALGQENGGRK
jgi:hypothetical protein